MIWFCKRFNELLPDEIYSILSVREEVFVVEQTCIYRDIDGLDKSAWHLFTKDERGEIIAYLRLLDPGLKYHEPSLGRVLTTKKVRGTGMGRLLLADAMERAKELYPTGKIRISAQEHLIKFYGDFGFGVVGEPYDEDGIQHIEMLLKNISDGV